MFDPELRTILNRSLEVPLTKISRRITPNMATSFGLLIGLTAPAAIFYEFPIIAVFLFLLNRLIDAFDGAIARHRGHDSDFGEIFDVASDFIIYALIPISIAYRYGNENAMLITAFLIGSYYVNAGIMLSVSRIPDPRSRGLIEGFETIIFYCAMILATKYFNQIASVFAFLVFITAIARLFKLYFHVPKIRE